MHVSQSINKYIIIRKAIIYVEWRTNRSKPIILCIQNTLLFSRSNIKELVFCAFVRMGDNLGFGIREEDVIVINKAAKAYTLSYYVLISIIMTCFAIFPWFFFFNLAKLFSIAPFEHFAQISLTLLFDEVAGVSKLLLRCRELAWTALTGPPSPAALIPAIRLANGSPAPPIRFGAESRLFTPPGGSWL